MILVVSRLLNKNLTKIKTDCIILNLFALKFFTVFFVAACDVTYKHQLNIKAYTLHRFIE